MVLSPAQRRHLRVKKWTRNINIFEKDFVVIPINKSAHWYLAIICYPSLITPEFGPKKTHQQQYQDQSMDLNTSTEKIDQMNNDMKNKLSMPMADENSENGDDTANRKVDVKAISLDIDGEESLDEAESVNEELNISIFNNNDRVCTKM